MLFGVVIALAVAGAQEVSSNEDFCAELEKILGHDCKAQKPNCLTVECVVNLLDVERVRINLDLYGLCLDTDEKNIKFTIVEADLDVHYTKTLNFDSTGYNGEFPIPGLAVKIPITGISAGVYGVVNISGTEGDFTLDAGLDACATTTSQNKLECGSSLTHDLPVWLIRGSANATAACLAPTPPPTPPTPPPTPDANVTAACNVCIDHKDKAIGHNKVWCWETNKCYDLGDVVHDKCFDDECSSKARSSSCELKTCNISAY